MHTEIYLYYVYRYGILNEDSQKGPATVPAGNTKGGKYHCTIDLLFDWFGLACFANENKNCQ
jgi:hypothetical protein